MKRMACVLGLLLLAAACRSTATEGPTPTGPIPSVASVTAPDASAMAPVDPPPTNGVCAPSSVAKGIACPKIKVPPGTGASPEGCQSDADCKAGKEGRCIQWHLSLLDSPPAERTNNLLAAPRRPEPRSKCVYDECQTDRECGKGMRCTCGSGVGPNRNECKAVDACLADRDCKPGTVCACAGGGAPNTCIAGNCHTSADCGGLACEYDSNGGMYCRTPRDACGLPKDCTTPANSYDTRICVFQPEVRARVCGIRPPPPPG